MSKLSYEDKVNIYLERKQGNPISNISKKYKVRDDVIKYLIRLIDKHGFDILRTNKNRKFAVYEKEQIINRVLINKESVYSVAIDEGLLSYGMLFNWIKKYQDMGYNIVERKRGRSPTMLTNNKEKQKETIEEENERLKKENLYLKAQLEYSKKLRAVVQARKNQQQKKK